MRIEITCHRKRSYYLEEYDEAAPYVICAGFVSSYLSSNGHTEIEAKAVKDIMITLSTDPFEGADKAFYRPFIGVVFVESLSKSFSIYYRLMEHIEKLLGLPPGLKGVYQFYFTIRENNEVHN